MMIKAKCLAAAAVAALVTGMAPALADDKPIDITIGWAPPDVSGVFKTATNFFEASAKQASQNGFNVKVITTQAQSHDIAQQANAIEDLIQQKVDVIATSPADVNAIRPALKHAAEAGIPVIVVNLLEPIKDVKVSSYIGFDNTVAGEVSAYAVADYFSGTGVLSGKTDVKPETYLDLDYWKNAAAKLTPDQKAAIKAKGVIIEGVAGNFYSVTRLKGFKEVIAQFPGIQIVGNSCAADWKRELGTTCAEDFLQANPDIDFIWAASNEMGLGAMLAARNAGRLETTDDGVKTGDGKVAIFMNDVTPESVDRIAEGRVIGETTHGFADWGWYGGKVAVELACKLDTPATFDIRPRTVDKANARLFYPSPKLEEIDWKTIRANCKK